MFSPVFFVFAFSFAVGYCLLYHTLCCGNLLPNMVCFEKAKYATHAFRCIQRQRWCQRWGKCINIQFRGEAWKCEIKKLHCCGYVNLFLNWKMYKLNQISGIWCNLETEKIFDFCIADFYQQLPCGKLHFFDKDYFEWFWEEGLILGFQRFSFEFPCGQIWHFATELWEMAGQNFKI